MTFGFVEDAPGRGVGLVERFFQGFIRWSALSDSSLHWDEEMSAERAKSGHYYWDSCPASTFASRSDISVQSTLTRGTGTPQSAYLSRPA